MIRDFRIGTAFRLGFTVWLRNIAPFTLLTTIVYTPLILWAMGLARGSLDAEQIELFGGGAALFVWFLNIFLTGALTYGVVMELRGERAGLLRCVGIGLRRFFPVLGVSLLSALAIVGGTIALVVPGIILTCMLYVAVPASVVERPGVMGALKRSRFLTQGNKLQVFGLLLLLALLNGALAIIVQRSFLDGGVIENTPVDRLPTYIYAEVVRLIVTGPLAAVMPAVSYFLLREEREGVSAEQLARVFE